MYRRACGTVERALVCSPMSVKAASLLLFLSLSTGSMCNKPSGNGEVSKDLPESTADVNLPEVDTTTLTPREKHDWSAYVSELLAPCTDVPVPIAQCVQEKRSCNKCVPAAKMIMRAVRDGYAKEQVEHAFHNRFDATSVRNVPIDDSPARGSSSAPIVLVEFADFTCPHCQALAPQLDKFVDDRKEQIRFAYKFMPLSGPGHERAEPAARAAWAAGLQGKFWEMHKKLFENPEHLEQGDFEAYAKEMGLDVAKFRKDMDAPPTADKIAADRKLGDALDVKGTPTIFINGREFDKGGQGLEDWIDLELQLKAPPKAQVVPSATPSASASAKPK
jgi:predicted DsbA family dithiol-disulfide isomerase